MNGTGTGSTLVRRVRTFADDVRRAQAGGAVPLVPQPASVPTPPARPPASALPAVMPPQPPSPISPSTPEAGAPQTPPNQPPEIAKLLDEQDTFKQGEADRGAREGTIIRDARSKRWRLRKALGNSLNAWMEEQKGTLARLTDNKEQKPRVPPLATRMSVVQAARQKSALAPKDDRRDVVEKLRTFARDAERVTGKKYTLMRKEGSSTPRWTYVEDGKTPQADAAVKQARPTIRPPQPPPAIRGDAPQTPLKILAKDVAPLADQGLPERVFEPQPLTEKGAEKPKPSVRMDRLPYGAADVAPVAERPQEPEPVEAPPEPAPPPQAQQPDNAREDAIKRLLAVRKERKKPTAPSRDIPFTLPTFDTQKTTNVRTYRDDAIRDVEEHKKSIPQIAAAEHIRSVRRSPQAPAAHHAAPVRPFVIAGVVMIVMIAVGGFGIFWYARQGTVEKTTVVRVPTFIAIEAQKSIPFSSNRAALLDALAAETKSAQAGIAQIYPAYPEGEGEKSGRAVSTSEFMYVLDPRAPGSFTRNLEAGMMFGVYNATDPFFIFKTKQFDTAFAGMIDWEPYISNDLTPLFGEPVERSYDRTARTADQTTAARFVDEQKGNVDVRILYDETGAERIMYAFVGRNTIVITTSTTALTELLGRLQ